MDNVSLLPTLKKISRVAYEAIMAGYEGRQVENWTKSDASPSPEADLAADRRIRQGLTAAFPEIPVVSEEVGPGRASVGERFFLVEPLDGRKEFLKRYDEFTLLYR